MSVVLRSETLIHIFPFVFCLLLVMFFCIAGATQYKNSRSCQGCHLHSSQHFQIASAGEALVQRQGEVPPHHLCAPHMVTRIHRQLCLCQSLEVINFWPSFIAQMFMKLVIKNSFGSHFSKCKSSNWVQGASWETIIFINIFLCLPCSNLKFLPLPSSNL